MTNICGKVNIVSADGFAFTAGCQEVNIDQYQKQTYDTGTTKVMIYLYWYILWLGTKKVTSYMYCRIRLGSNS